MCRKSPSRLKFQTSRLPWKCCPWRWRLVLLLLAAVYGLEAFGQTWTLTSAPLTNWSTLACSADGTRIIATVSGLSEFSVSLPGPIYVSTNSGTNWSLTPAPTTVWASAASSADGSILSAGSLEFGLPVFSSTNFGANWFPSGSPATNQWISLASSADAQTLAAAYPGGGHVPGGVFTSTDGGANWTQILHDFYTWGSVASSAPGNIIVASTDYPGIYRSTNSGQTWTATNNPAGYGSHWIRLSADGTRLVAAGAGGGISVSTNLGDTWQIISATNLSWTSLACSADAKTIIAASGTRNSYYPVDPGPIHFSTNAGATWVQANLPNAKWAAVACSADGNKLFAADSQAGIYSLQIVPSPQLEIRISGTDVLLSWLIPSMPFVLQQMPSLTAPAWNEILVTPPLNLTNLHNEVPIPRSAGAQFFRLAQSP
jgi:hypothetical protein